MFKLKEKLDQVRIIKMIMHFNKSILYLTIIKCKEVNKLYSLMHP